MILSEKYRPKVLADVIGQERIVGPNGVITTMLAHKTIRSCIFYGPPGCGKTTTAKIIAELSGYPFVSLNATQCKIDDIRKAVNSRDDMSAPILLYLDEIQYFNVKQQQSLLPYIENNDIVLVASTTDNPYHCCYDALISRCSGLILRFYPISTELICDKLTEVIEKEGFTAQPDAVRGIAENSTGDMRKALNLLDVVLLQMQTKTITAEDVIRCKPDINMFGFDTNGDQHFELKSGLQKAIRGSDPNAALFYLARFLEGGDIISPCRRLTVIAHEDIGLADPNAIPFVRACIEDAQELGLPEAAKPLTNAVLYLALAKKSNTAEVAYEAAAQDVRLGKGRIIPTHLKHSCAKGYIYPHDYPDHWVDQQYLPDDIRNAVYYSPGDNSFEWSANKYWQYIKDQHRNS